MVKLPSSNTLNKVGIDTIERAIAYSAIVLKASITKNEPESKITNEIKIAHIKSSTSGYILKIEASLAYDNIKALSEGGRILDSLVVKDSLELVETQFFCPPSLEAGEIIPQDLPYQLSSLEQYFFYHCCLLNASLPIESGVIEIQYLERANIGGIAAIKIFLPLDFNSWLLGSNYVCSVKRATETYASLTGFKDIFNSDLTAMDNNAEMNNTNVMGN